MNDTLLARSWPVATTNTLLRPVALMLAGSLFIALCAHIKVPMWPVPMTMQTFAVLLIGMAYGPRLGAGTVALYLAEGAAGLPVFATGAGIAYFAGPTGGYLIGFLIAAFVTGWLAARGWDRTIPHAFAAMTLGVILIFIPGVLWLSNLIGMDKAIAAGLLPFLAGAFVKTLLGALVLPFAHRLLDRFRT